jgi:hypothetical protein
LRRSSGDFAASGMYSPHPPPLRDDDGGGGGSACTTADDAARAATTGASPQPARTRVGVLPRNSSSTLSTTSSVAESDTDGELLRIFATAVPPGCSAASSRIVLAILKRRGLMPDDPRITDAISLLTTRDTLEQAEFVKMVGDNQLIERALFGLLAIPDFASFCDDVTAIHRETEQNTDGAPADYIPQLACVDPDQYGVGVCTIDGQRFSCGDVAVPFCVQSTTKPLAYAMALEQHGEEKVHRHVGREPSGRNFNERVLNNQNLPHNPMINAGAIMTASLVRPDLKLVSHPCLHSSSRHIIDSKP